MKILQLDVLIITLWLAKGGNAWFFGSSYSNDEKRDYERYNYAGSGCITYGEINDDYTGVISSDCDNIHRASKFSACCLLYGDQGCEMKCNLKCTLYECTPKQLSCDSSFHCDCEETYSLGRAQLSQNDFEFLEFNELWKNTFKDDLWSERTRKSIRRDKKIEKYVLGLLRNSHISGDDIIALLRDKYDWHELKFLTSSQQARKTKLIGAGKTLRYEDLEDHFDELVELMETQPLDNIGKVKYRRRLRKFLASITNIADLEELLHLVKLSGNKKLYRLTKSMLKNLGYGFEEDGDSATDKKAILKDICANLRDADEDELFDVVIMNKLIPTKSTPDVAVEPVPTAAAAATVEVAAAEEKTSPPSLAETDQLNLATNSISSTSVSASLGSTSLSYGVEAPLPASTDTQFDFNLNTQSNSLTQGSGTGAQFGADLNTHSNSQSNSLSYGSGTGAQFGSDLNAHSNSQSYGSGSGATKSHTLYYLVVDENGKVSQASAVPRISFWGMPTTPAPPNGNTQNGYAANQYQWNIPPINPAHFMALPFSNGPTPPLWFSGYGVNSSPPHNENNTNAKPSVHKE